MDDNDIDININIDRNGEDAIADQWDRAEEIAEEAGEEFGNGCAFAAQQPWFAAEHNPWSSPAFASTLDTLRRKRMECQEDGRRVLAQIAALRGEVEETEPALKCLWGIVKGISRQIQHIDALEQAIGGAGRKLSAFDAQGQKQRAKRIASETEANSFNCQRRAHARECTDL